MARKPKMREHGDWLVEWLAETVAFSFLPILFLILICVCISQINAAYPARDLIFQAVRGGEVILCAFAVVLPSFTSFTKENSRGVYYLLLFTALGDIILYVALKIMSILPGSSGSGSRFVLVISVVCAGASILFSFLSKQKLVENRMTETPATPLRNDEQKEVPQ